MMYIPVEFLVGQHINSALQEMIHLSKQLKVGTTCSFNGVTLYVREHSDIKMLHAQYQNNLARNMSDPNKEVLTNE